MNKYISTIIILAGILSILVIGVFPIHAHTEEYDL